MDMHDKNGCSATEQPFLLSFGMWCNYTDTRSHTVALCPANEVYSSLLAASARALMVA